MSRPKWDAYFLTVANAVARRADCTRSRVGAVLVRPDHTLIQAGYNGTDPGELGCLEGYCPRGRLTYRECPSDAPFDHGPGICIAYHAEENALRFAEEHNLSVVGATCYITRDPCPECQRRLAFAGVKRVVWPWGEIEL